jgi:hypothetical protein
LAACAVGKLARDAGGYKEGEQRYPILGVGHGKGSDGREKIVIESKCGQQGEKDREAKPPIRGYPQHHQQKRQRHRGRIHMDDAPVGLRHKFGRRNASGIAKQVLGTNFHAHDCNRSAQPFDKYDSCMDNNGDG